MDEVEKDNWNFLEILKHIKIKINKYKTIKR